MRVDLSSVKVDEGETGEEIGEEAYEDILSFYIDVWREKSWLCISLNMNSEKNDGWIVALYARSYVFFHMIWSQTSMFYELLLPTSIKTMSWPKI